VGAGWYADVFQGGRVGWGGVLVGNAQFRSGLCNVGIILKRVLADFVMIAILQLTACLYNCAKTFINSAMVLVI